ncbi:2-aminoethanethiol dioxygenase isoform X1 [Chelonia mydas]|uniref:2-aminoethanethiol dioxygenase isoform X1 n=2 Tax=Chelonia mydas TaxID=8469 RepID=UPI0018A21E42|nr:2-aminoethanethiol dioxygenase isoform X1 [Chelonia mydas]
MQGAVRAGAEGRALPRSTAESRGRAGSAERDYLGGTMPRDNMASLIQRVAKQARITFRGPAPGPGFGENLHRLQQLLNEVQAEDLHLAPRGPAAVPGAGCSRAGAGAGAVPPVSYMHICETESFSMGVFLLRSGACIPLHDHPGMNGMLKVLYGSLRIACLDPLPPAAPPGARRRALLRSRQLYTPASPPCLLSPHTDNLHQIDAVDGPAAFLDILAPPYDPENGRDCHYYRLLEAPAGPAADPHALPREVWLLETPQAADFWCGGEPYPGPKVSP